MSQQTLHVVLGATGGVGQHIVAALEDRGHSVRAVSRSGTNVGSDSVEATAADLAERQGAIAAIRGASVVYMAAAPAYYEWRDEFAPMIENVITGAEQAGAKLVMVDNFYMYGPDVTDIREDSPQDPLGHKGRARKAVAEQLLAAHAEGRCTVVIGRLSDYFGPGGINSASTITLTGPALEGKTIRWSGHPNQQHTLHYLPDVGRAFVTLGEQASADGEVWILPAADPLTGNELVDLVNSLVEKPAKWARPPAVVFTVMGLFNKMMRELKETTYQFDQRYVSCSEKFEEAFGPFETTSMEDGYRATLDWYRNEADVPKVTA